MDQHESRNCVVLRGQEESRGTISWLTAHWQACELRHGTWGKISVFKPRRRDAEWQSQPSFQRFLTSQILI